jgi:hypothetical protein
MIHIINHTLMITGFVFVMMVIIEYVNVLTSGTWQEKITHYQWKQYIIAAFLGAAPGCLGAFAVVAMYSHRMLTVGAVVAAMIATSGDEAFVMLAMIPRQAVIITVIIFITGIPAGALTDFILKNRRTSQPEMCEGFQTHLDETCQCFPREFILQQWKECSAARGILAAGLVVFLIAVISGQIGPSEWNWKKLTVSGLSALSLFIVSTVPDHFLEEHLWNHVARKHFPRIFLWTLGTLLILHILTVHLNIESSISKAPWVVLVIACLVGLIPESGPHLFFVTLYAQGMIPLSILLASSIVQDGHGMLPMLAHSRRAFFVIKGINFAVGIVLGATGLSLGL